MVALADFPRRPVADSRRSHGRHRGFASKIRDYIFGSYIDEALCMVKANGDRFFFSTNDLYSVYALTDADGTVVERYMYSPYGACIVLAPDGVTVRTASLYGNPWTFTGRRLDGETGLMYFRNRMYEVDLGRFVSRDPIDDTSKLLTLAATEFSWKTMLSIAESKSSKPRFVPKKLAMLSQNAISGMTRLAEFDRLCLYAFVSNRPSTLIDPTGTGMICDCAGLNALPPNFPAPRGLGLPCGPALNGAMRITASPPTNQCLVRPIGDPVRDRLNDCKCQLFACTITVQWVCGNWGNKGWRWAVNASWDDCP